MKVSLIAEGFSTDRPLGTARYAHELAAHLKGVDLDLIGVGQSTRRGEFFLRSHLNRLRRPSGDVIHALDPSFFIDKKKSAVTFHDLMHRDSDYSMKVYERASKADAAIAVSTQTADQLHSYFGVDAQVIPEGVSECFKRDPSIQKSPFSIIYVGDINPRKRLELLIEGFAKLHMAVKEARLTIIGKPIAQFNNGYESKLVQLCHSYDLNGAVRFIGYLGDNLLNVYLNQAKALVLPSSEEGFGLPLLEAQACGTPTFIFKDARIPPETSVYSEAVEDTDELADELERTIESGWNVPLMDEMAENARLYTWARTSELTKQVYDTLI